MEYKGRSTLKTEMQKLVSVSPVLEGKKREKKKNRKENTRQKQKNPQQQQNNPKPTISMALDFSFLIEFYQHI